MYYTFKNYRFSEHNSEWVLESQVNISSLGDPLYETIDEYDSLQNILDFISYNHM